MAQLQSSWKNGIRYAARSDIGLRRTNNQDCYGVVLAATEESWRSRGHLFVVADGMGAHAAGELASKLAADTIAQCYRKRTELPTADAMLAAVREANSMIHDRGEANAEFHGMGTTASMLVLLPDVALVAHVGDSRVYRLRGNRLDQLTYDHSLVWEMMSSSNLTADQVPAYLPKNIITRSLGPSAHVEVDLEGPFPIQQGDTFLLCSDGLTGQVSDEEICQILMTLPPEEAVEILVDLANLRGGPDNITVIVVQVTQTQPNGEAAEQSAAVHRHGNWRTPWLALAGSTLVAFVLAIVLAMAGIWLATILAAIVAAALGLGAVLAARRPTQVQAGDVPAGQYGRGPHRTHACIPNQAFADRLTEVDQQLKQAAVSEGWNIDWKRFDAFERHAQAAAAHEDFADAVAGYCRAISFLMGQLRQQRSKQAGA
jgi:protein phosphatase